MRLFSLTSEAAVNPIIGGLLTDACSFYSDCRVSLDNVEVEHTVPLSRAIDATRVDRALVLVEAVRHCDLKIFEPMLVEVEDAQPWRLLLPPVVEAAGSGRYLIVDGVHRLYATRSLGHRQVQVVVISDVTAPPPAEPKAWTELRVSDRHLSPADIIGPHDISLFRPIASRLGQLRFDSRRELDDFLAIWSDRDGG